MQSKFSDFSSRLLLMAAGLFLAAGATKCEAATLVVYPFSLDASPSVLGAGVTASLDFSNISVGTGVYDDGFGNVLQAYPNSGSTSAALALANNSFFSLTMSITPGSFGQIQVQYEVGKGGDSDPRGYMVRSSLDTFASDVFSEILPNGAQQAPALQSFLLDLTGQSTVELRFYVYTPIPGDNSVDFRNLAVTNSDPEPEPDPEPGAVPEPATWALTGFGIAAASVWRRRRAN